MGHTCKLTSGASSFGFTFKSGGAMHVYVYKVISTTKLSPRCWAVGAVTIPSLAYLCPHSLQVVTFLLYIHMAFDIFLSYLCLTQIRPRSYYCYQYSGPFTYPDLSYLEYSVIQPQSLHILFNAHAAYGAKYTRRCWSFDHPKPEEAKIR